MGATTPFKRESQGTAVVFKATSAAAALLALGFLTVPCAMASSDTQIISGSADVTYSSGLSIDTAVADPDTSREAQLGLYIADESSVAGENDLSIAVGDNGAAPRTFSALKVTDSALEWNGSVAVSAESAAASSVTAVNIQGSKVTLSGDSVTLTSGAQSSGNSFGLFLKNGADVHITAAHDFQLKSSSSVGQGYGIQADNGTSSLTSSVLSIEAENISVYAGGAPIGIEANEGAQVSLTAKNSLSVQAVSGQGRAYGLMISGWSGQESTGEYHGSSLTLDGKSVAIEARQTTSDVTDRDIFGLYSVKTDKDLHSTVIGENAESVSIAASSAGGADLVRAVNIYGGTVALGNENAVISLSAVNPGSYADGIQISGAKAELDITAKELNVSASANEKAVGIRVSDNARLTVDAVANISVEGGTNADVTAEGIRVYNANGTKTIQPATQDAVFKKAVTVNVSSSGGQSARGVSVLSSAATDASENDPDNGAKLTLEDALTVNVSSSRNASGVEVDNNFLDGSRAGTTVTGTAGQSAELEIGGVFTANVEAAEQAAGAVVMKGGTLTAKGGMTAAVSGNKAYGILVTGGSSANIAGPVSLTVSGQAAGFGISMSDSTAEIGTADTAADISVTGESAYALNLLNSDLTVNGSLNVRSGKIKLADSKLLLKGEVTIAGGLDSVEGGLMTVEGSYATLSSDIFNVGSDDTTVETGGIKDGVTDKIAFGEKAELVLQDEYYTLKYLADAKEQSFGANNPTIVMTGSLAGELTADDLASVPENSVLVKAEITSQGDLALDDGTISGDSLGIGSVSVGEGTEFAFSSDAGKTLTVIGRNGALISGKEAVTVKVDSNGTLALGGERSEGGVLQGDISASGASKVTVKGGKADLKEFSVSGSIRLTDSAALEISDSARLSVSELYVDKGTTLTVGSADSAGRLSAKVLNLKGRAFFDPEWTDGEENPTMVAAETLQIDEGGQMTVARNSTFTAGSADETAALNAVKAAGHTLAKDDITAAMLVNGTVSVGSGAITVDGSVAEATSADLTAGTVTIADNALLAIAATNDTASGSAVVFEGATLNLAGNSVLYVDLSEVTTAEDLQMKLADTVNSEIAAGNILGSSALWYNYAITDGVLTASYDPTSKLVENGLIAANTVRESIMTGGAGSDALNELIAAGSFTAAANYANRKALMATASAAQILAVNTGNMITDTIEEHGSALAGYAHKAGADLWIDINGSFSKATSYKAGAAKYGYRADLAGVTIGADYALGNGAAFGGAFSFGTGSARGQGAGAGTKNDVDYYGLNIYGVLATDYVNVIGNIGYSIGKNEIKQSGATGKPDVKTLSLGVRAEKSLAVTDGFDVTPHIGIRYMNIDMDSFTAGGFKYSAKKANLAQVPFGVAFSGSFKASCGAAVKPFVDVTVAPAFGDKKVTNRFALAGGTSSDSIDARIANSSMYQGRIGLNAVKGSHSLGINYGVGGGNNGRVDQSLQARYRYSF